MTPWHERASLAKTWSSRDLWHTRGNNLGPTSVTFKSFARGHRASPLDHKTIYATANPTLEPDEIRVLVVDDHDLFRSGVTQLLRENGVSVAGEADCGDTALQLVEELNPDAVLMDLNMPGMSGVEATRRLSETAPLVRIVILTILADEPDVTDALMAGACGYLLKDASIEQIVTGIRAATRGESPISPRIASKLVGRLRHHPELEAQVGVAELTNREVQVLDHIARGLDNPQIAEALFISHNTVKNHVSSILTKLEVENRVQAAVRAVKTRIL